MSMELHLRATIEAVSKLGKHVIQQTYGLNQTPTTVTQSILASPDIKQAYIDWMENTRHWDTADEYSEIVERIEELEQWLKAHEGWEIEWYSM